MFDLTQHIHQTKFQTALQPHAMKLFVYIHVTSMFRLIFLITASWNPNKHGSPIRKKPSHSSQNNASQNAQFMSQQNSTQGNRSQSATALKNHVTKSSQHSTPNIKVCEVSSLWHQLQFHPPISNFKWIRSIKAYSQCDNDSFTP